MNQKRYFTYYCLPAIAPSAVLAASACLQRHAPLPIPSSPPRLREHYLALFEDNSEKARAGARCAVSGDPSPASKDHRGEIQGETASKGKGVGVAFFPSICLAHLTMPYLGKVSKTWMS